jgi:hypothetical protein
MKASLLAVTLALWSPAAAQNIDSIPEKHDQIRSIGDQIRAARAKEKMDEKNAAPERPWDRDANGKRPWERQQPPE